MSDCVVFFPCPSRRCKWPGAPSMPLPFPGVARKMIVFAIFVLALTDYKFAFQPVSASQWYHSTANDVGGKLKSAEGHGCRIPSPLKNGVYSPSRAKCSSKDPSPACRMVPGTHVQENWVLWHKCNPGYTVEGDSVGGDTSEKRPTICRNGQWSPPLPACVESHYNSDNLPQFQSSSSYCGKPADHSRNKWKVHGTAPRKGDWPWMVIFGVHKNSTQGGGIHWFCAGTLVTTRHILTAAHCVADHRKRDKFFARFNDINLNSTSDDKDVIEIEIQINNIVIHPGFKKEKVYSDNLAIVKLNEDLSITDFVRPICLPTPDFSEKSFNDESVYFTTWGQADTKYKIQPTLQEVQGTVVNHALCNYNYKSYQSEDFFVIDWKLICASIPLNKNCRGDTGSPLMLKSKDKYVLIGVVATPFRCFGEQFPRLFTRLSLFMDWVIANLKL